MSHKSFVYVCQLVCEACDLATSGGQNILYLVLPIYYCVCLDHMTPTVGVCEGGGGVIRSLFAPSQQALLYRGTLLYKYYISTL